MEGGTEGIADDLEDKAVVLFDRRAQDLMVSPAETLPGIGMFPRQAGAAFNIREQECDGSGWDGHEIIMT
jgi:hypothetical protein